MNYGCQPGCEEGIRYQSGEIRARRWRLCSLIHGAAVTVASYFAFHENVFVCLSSPKCGAGALKHLSYLHACTRHTHTHIHTHTRAREHTYTNATAEHNINIRNRTLCTCTVAEISRIYDIRRLSSQSYAIKRRRALSSFRQSAGCASKLIMHPNRRDMRVKVSSPSLPPSLPLSLSLYLGSAFYSPSALPLSTISLHSYSVERDCFKAYREISQMEIVLTPSRMMMSRQRSRYFSPVIINFASICVVFIISNLHYFACYFHINKFGH